MGTGSRADASAAAGPDTAYVRLALPALAGAAAAYVVWRLAADAGRMPDRVVLGTVPAYVALWLAAVGVHACRWRMVLRRLGSDVPLLRLVRLWLAGRAVGILIPSGTLGGEPVRAQLLAASGVPTARAAGSVALDRALELAGNMIVGPASIAIALAYGVGSRSALLVAAGAGLAGLATLAGVYVRALQGRPALVHLATPLSSIAPARWHDRLRAQAVRADAAMQAVLAEHPRLVPVGLGLSLVNEVLQFVQLAALFAVFALAVPLPLLLLSSMGVGVAHAIPVTAALGTLEATQVGLFTIGGEPLATGLAVALAIRLAETAAILVGLVCLATARARGVKAPPP